MDIKPVLAFAVRLSRHEVLTAVLAVIALLCPGIWTLWVFDRVFVQATSTPKLLVLAASIAAPVVLINTIFNHLGTQAAAERQRGDVDKTRLLLYALARGSISTIAVFGYAVLLCAFFGWSSRTFLLLLIALQGLFLMLAYKMAASEDLPTHLFPGPIGKEAGQGPKNPDP